jgi:Bacterial Ig-like domain (group 2)
MRVTRRHTSRPDRRRRIVSHSGMSVPCRRAAATLIAVIGAILACQNAPTDSGEPPDGTQVDSLRIVAPSTLLVNDATLLSAQAWKSRQKVYDSQITWNSSDPSIARVRPSGATSAILTAVRRGTVTITAFTGDIVDEVTLRVTAELRIQPDHVLDVPYGWPMAVGDQLQLEAVYVDAIGQAIPEIPSVTWSSTNAAGVSVSPAGLVTATQANYHATVTANGTDDTVSVRIRVLDVLAGQPATLRIVHGIPGIGPIRFLVSQGAPLSLSYGQSVELPIVSGTLRVDTEGLPPGDPAFGDPSGKFVGVVRPGDHLSLYAVGNTQGAFLQPAWPPTASIPPDSGLVRLIQSSPAMVVYLRADGAPISGLPELCYFDPGVVSDYFVRAAGGFDIIGQDKYDGQQEIGRISARVLGGRAVTMVLTGGGQQPLSVLTFTDR